MENTNNQTEIVNSRVEVLEVIRINYVSAFPAERKIMDYIMRHPQDVVNCNVSDLAKASDVSDASVVRMCHTLGYNGYKQFRLALAMDLGKKTEKAEAEMEMTGNPVSAMFEDFGESLRTVSGYINEETLRDCVTLIKNANIVYLVAIGNTANLSQYMGFRLERIGIKSAYYRESAYTLSKLNFAQEGDVLIAISKSGISKDVIEAAQLAKEKGLPILAITASVSSPLANIADHVLLSNGNMDPKNFHKTYSYLNEMAIVDALLSFVVNDELIRKITK